MSGCCSGGARVTVEVRRVVVDGDTCERCGSTWDAAEAAAAAVAAELASIGVIVDVVERQLPPSAVDESNRVFVAGRPAEEWLGGSVASTDCPSCGDLLGQSTCCPAYEIGGVSSDTLSADDIARAIRIAAGLAPGAAARPEGSAVAVTFVPAPSCGCDCGLMCDPDATDVPDVPEGAA